MCYFDKATSAARWVLLASLLLPIHTAIATPTDDSFDQHIAPLLATRCLNCHNASDKKGELDLSREASVRAGGESGDVISNDLPDESLLWQKVSDDEMPPDKPLTQNEKQLLRRWIADGANWGTDPIDPFLFSNDNRSGYDWWSLQPIERPELPTVLSLDWPRNEIDHFVLAKLESSGLKPAEQADARTLLRRLYFDLIGLPPIVKTEQGIWIEETLGIEIDPRSFPNDATAYAAVVDALLASPHFGERWARHWLDVVRYGESQGFERNRVRENLWRYRDWVIRAFNQDLPYDEFIRLQIAGDVLAPNDLNALLATGFLVCGPWDLVGATVGSPEMRKSVRQEVLEDMVAAVGQSVLGLTINCARCHDHKFDPISQKEYYQFTALLGGVTQTEFERKEISLLPASDNDSEPDDELPSTKTAVIDPTLAFEGTAHVIIPVQPPEYHVLVRGNSRTPSEVVSPRGLKALSSGGLSDDFGLGPEAAESERRVALAHWLTDNRNPLTSRVLVNRLWQYHFGRGIVDTPSDFGYSGGQPSHPELLDWLASRLIDQQWKLKDLHRLMVTSATYRQASNIDSPNAEKMDAENRLRWRGQGGRLDGEAIRDSMLLVSSALNRKLGGPSIRDVNVKLEENHVFGEPTNEFNNEVNRRTIYRMWARCGNNSLLSSLDCPDPSVMLPVRPQTITPLQSLSLLNNPLVEHCGERLAQRIHDTVGDEIRLQIDELYRVTLSRNPQPQEIELAGQFLETQSLAQLCVVLLNTNEFLYVE